MLQSLSYTLLHQDGFDASSSAAISIVSVVLSLLMVVAMWRIYTKAGQMGLAALIPIYNIYVLLKIVGRPGWWLLLLFVPLVNIVVALSVYFGLAKVFGRGPLFGLGLIFLAPIFILILGFDNSKYVGPAHA